MYWKAVRLVRDGIPRILMISGDFHLVERGKSNPNSKTIDLGKEWTDNRGLFYKQVLPII